MFPDYYLQLGVSPSASADELKRSWRAAAFALHPDRNPGSDGAAFRAAAEAWEILGDAGRRSRYDAVRGAWGAQGAQRPSQSYRPSRHDPPPAQPGITRPDPRARARWEEDERRAADARDRRERAFRAEQRAARAAAYAAEQEDLESLFGEHGWWTREGTLRTGGAGRRRVIGQKDVDRVQAAGMTWVPRREEY